VKDSLGDRMKDQYERRAQTHLPRRTYTIIRLDGKAFRSYTRGLQRPYDKQLMDDMAETTRYLCQEVQGCRFGYTQSDEITLLLTDFATNKTEAWFDGNVQKIVSVSASLATAKFNELRPGKLALFDSRVFTIPDPVEVVNQFLWRQKDATRNSITMLAECHFSAKQLHGVSSDQRQEMLFREKGINWAHEDERFKNGTVVFQRTVEEPVLYKLDGEPAQDTFERRKWVIDSACKFSWPESKGFLLGLEDEDV
jgi:tRNA(His) guanylyltransferase